MADTMFTPLFDRDLICQSGPSSFGCGMTGRFGMGMYSNPYMNTSFLGEWLSYILYIVVYIAVHICSTCTMWNDI